MARLYFGLNIFKEIILKYLIQDFNPSVVWCEIISEPLIYEYGILGTPINGVIVWFSMV